MNALYNSTPFTCSWSKIVHILHVTSFWQLWSVIKVNIWKVKTPCNYAYRQQNPLWNPSQQSPPVVAFSFMSIYLKLENNTYKSQFSMWCVHLYRLTFRFDIVWDWQRTDLVLTIYVSCIHASSLLVTDSFKFALFRLPINRRRVGFANEMSASFVLIYDQHQDRDINISPCIGIW